MLVIGVFSAITVSLKYLIQVTIASMLIDEFVPFWDGYEASCEEPFKEGGIPYSETVAAAVATTTFYCLAPGKHNF